MSENYNEWTPLMPSTNFLFRGQRLHLVYKTHIDKYELYEYINMKIQESSRTPCPVKMVRCANYPPDNAINYARTSVIIDFGRIWKCSFYDRFDYNGYQPMWIPIKRVAHWNNLLKYIARDPDNAGLLPDEPIKEDSKLTIEDIRSMSLNDAYNRMGRNPLHYIALKKIQEDTEVTDVEPYYFDVDNTKWSYRILGLINKVVDPTKGDNRTIHWYYSCRGGPCNDGGGLGKTSLGVWLEEKFPNWLYLNYSGRSGDMIRAMQNEMNNRGWNKRTTGVHGVYIDLNRTIGDHIELYRFLESICNRKLVATKYDSTKLSLRYYVHVVVVANWPPKLVTRDSTGHPHRTTSSDRFSIREIISSDISIPIDRDKLVRYQIDRMMNPEHQLALDEFGIPIYSYNDIDLIGEEAD